MKKITIALLICGVFGGTAALLTLVITSTVLDGEAKPAVAAAGAVGVVTYLVVTVLAALLLRSSRSYDAPVTQPSAAMAPRLVVTMSSLFAAGAAAVILALVQWDPVPVIAIAITAGVAAVLAAVATITALAKMPGR